MDSLTGNLNQQFVTLYQGRAGTTLSTCRLNSAEGLIQQLNLNSFSQLHLASSRDLSLGTLSSSLQGEMNFLALHVQALNATQITKFFMNGLPNSLPVLTPASAFELLQQTPTEVNLI
jgi:hypothetical protein